MKPAATAFPLPDTLEPALSQLHAYWLSLKRGENDMPFSDDVDPTKLPELAGRLMLVTVFDDPDRYRFEAAGEKITDLYGAPVNGEFSDELEQRPPLDALTQQCSATVSQRAPTYFRVAASKRQAGYARILLPTWGDGHVMMLLGAVDDLMGG